MVSIDPDAVEQIPPEAASTYWKIAVTYGEPYYRSVVDGIRPALGGGGRLLDAGTGPGFLPVLLTELIDGVRIEAFDLTRPLVLYGWETAQERGVGDRISFFVGDCYHIPVGNRTYDFVISTGVLHALDRPVDALDEFHRVLKPKGIAFVFDPTIFDVPADHEIDLTEHEQEVFESYGLRSADEERPIKVNEAIQFGRSSAFSEIALDIGELGDLRLRLRRE